MGAGFRYRRRRYLHIEEAVFLVDRADLLLFVEQEVRCCSDRMHGHARANQVYLSPHNFALAMCVSWIRFEKWMPAIKATVAAAGQRPNF